MRWLRVFLVVFVLCVFTVGMSIPGYFLAEKISPGFGGPFGALTGFGTGLVVSVLLYEKKIRMWFNPPLPQ